MSIDYFRDPCCPGLVSCESVKMNVKLVNFIHFRESDQTVRFNKSIDLLHWCPFGYFWVDECL